MSTVSDNDNDSGRIYEEVKLVSSANGDNRIVGPGSNGGGCCRVSGEYRLVQKNTPLFELPALVAA